MLMPFSLSSRGARALGQGVDWHQRCARHDTQSFFLSGRPCRSPLKDLSGYRSVRWAEQASATPARGAF